MNTLVVYYSRTGNTKAIGEAIAEALNADIDEIIDLKKRISKTEQKLAELENMIKNALDEK